MKLAALLEARAQALTDRVLAQMYENPFWDERFGERGRRHASQDGRHHVSYLAQALIEDDPTILVEYARWLQGVLTSRGMCTRHLDENFERLGKAIADEDLPDGAQAARFLGVAREALLYPGGPARALQDRAPDLGRALVERLYAKHPEWEARWGTAGWARCADDITYHLSYLSDSIALGRPELFATYTRFIAGFLEKLSIPRAHLVETLDAIERALAEGAPEILASARDAFALARAELAELERHPDPATSGA